jgi:hypothetical protein
MKTHMVLGGQGKVSQKEQTLLSDLPQPPMSIQRRHSGPKNTHQWDLHHNKRIHGARTQRRQMPNDTIRQERRAETHASLIRATLH